MTPNKLNAEVVLLEDGGTKYILKFGMKTLMLLQNELGISLEDQNSAGEYLKTIKGVIGVVRILLSKYHPDLSDDDVCDLIDKMPGESLTDQVRSASEKINEVFRLAFGKAIENQQAEHELEVAASKN